MGHSERPEPGGRQSAPAEPDGWTGSLETGATYGVLVLLGLVLGVLGSFQSPWTLGPVPVAAIVFVLANLAMCRLAGWAMRTRLGAVAPAVAWLIVVIPLSARRTEGDLVIAGTTAGYVFILGGAMAALAGIAWTHSAALGPPGR